MIIFSVGKVNLRRRNADKRGEDKRRVKILAGGNPTSRIKLKSLPR